MAAPALGTYIVDFDFDIARAQAGARSLDRSAGKLAEKIEKSVGAASEKASKRANAAFFGAAAATAKSASDSAAAFEKAFARMERKSADTARAMARDMDAYTKNATSRANATSSVRGLAPDTQATLNGIKKVSSGTRDAFEVISQEGGKSAEESAKAFEAAFAKIEASAEKSVKKTTSLSKKQVSELSEVLTESNRDTADLMKTMSKGGIVSAGSIDQLRARQMRLKEVIEATFGSVEKATAGAARGYKRLEDAIQRATTVARRQRNAFQDGRGELSLAGFSWQGMGNALEQIAGSRGALVAGAGLLVTALREIVQLSVSIVSIFSTSDTKRWWITMGRDVRRGWEDAKRTFYGYAAAVTQFFARAPRFGTFGAAGASAQTIRGTDMSVAELFRPLPTSSSAPFFREQDDLAKQRSTLSMSATAKAIEEERRQNHERVKAYEDMVRRKVILAERGDQLIRDSSALMTEAIKKHERELQTAIDQRVAAGAREHAGLTNDKAARATVNTELDRLLKLELEQLGIAPGYVSMILTQTDANRDLSETIADINEELETLALKQALAQFDSDFGDQRKLTREYAERALRIADLTGKSDEYAAAMKRQIEQQLRAIDIAEIQRRQETVDQQAEVARGRGNIELQKKLAAASTANAVAIALKEKRTREYIAALQDLGDITLSQIEMERIQRLISVDQAKLELAMIRDEISLTNAYAGEIAKLTDRIDELTIARLRASADEQDHLLADVMDARVAEKPKQRLLEFNRLALELRREAASLWMSIEQQAVAAEQRSHEQRVLNYQALVTQRVIDEQQGNALILQSKELLDQRLRDIDADYGRDWERLVWRLTEKYIEMYRNVGAITERFADTTHALFSDVLFNGITEGLDGVESAFKSFAQAVLREITNILASRALAALLKMLPAFFGGTGAASAAAGASAAASSGGFTNPFTGQGGTFLTSSPSALGVSGSRLTSTKSSPIATRSASMTPQSARAPQPVIVEVSWSPEFVGGIVKAGAAQGAAQASRFVIPIVAEDIKNNGVLRKMIQTAV
jgi:hypothetical protein